MLLVFAAALCLQQGRVLAIDDGPSDWFSPEPREAESWQEQEFPLPAWPRDGRLLEPGFNTGSNNYRVLIDPDSISVGEDGVVRYTVVLEAATGVRNVIFEGLHCVDRTVRRMAYGIDGKWHLLADTGWERIAGSGIYAYRKQLYYHYLCIPDEPRASTRQIVNRLRNPVQALPE